jgi:protein-S-isoprenylcysteine O-methyltransferase Ste14
VADHADPRFRGSAATPFANAPEVSRARMTSPGVRFPPPFLFVGGFLLGLAAERWIWRTRLPGDQLRDAFAIAGWLGIVTGLLLAGWGIVTFLNSRTAIIPHHPASRLVQSGPYRFSRNPMYVGLTTLYVGLALLFDLVWPVLMLPFVLSALSYLVIRREERYLSDAFGDAYAAYRGHVRRWL